MKLVVFYTKKGLFSIYGNYSVRQEERGGKLFPVPEFKNLTMKEIKEDGSEIEYAVTGENWNGVKYDEYDVMHEFIMHVIINDNLYVPVYMEQGISCLIGEYTCPENSVANANGLNIPGKILNRRMDIFEAALVTNEFIYYADDDAFLMLITGTHEVVSDNYFAEEGFHRSAEAIRNETERVIWGTIPKEEEK